MSNKKPTDIFINYKNKKRKIYKGPRGGYYVKDGNKYISISKADVKKRSRKGSKSVRTALKLAQVKDVDMCASKLKEAMKLIEKNMNTITHLQLKIDKADKIGKKEDYSKFFLSGKAVHLRNENKIALKKIKELTTKIDAMTTTSITQSKELNLSKKNLEKCQKDMRISITDYRAQIQSLNQEIINYKNSIQDRNKTIQNLSDALQKLRRSEADCKSDLGRCKERLERKIEASGALTTALRGQISKDTYDKLISKHNECTKRVRKFAKRIADLEQFKNRSENVILDATKRYREQLTLFTNCKNAFERANDEMDKYKQIISQELNKKNAHIEEQKMDLETRKITIKNAEVLFSKEKNENIKIKIEIKKMKDLLTEVKNESVNLRNNNNNCENSRQTCQNLSQALTNDKNKLQENINNLQMEFTMCRQNLENCTKNSELKNNEHGKLERNLRAKLQKCDDDNKKIEEEKNTFRQDVFQLSNELAEFKNK